MLEEKTNVISRRESAVKAMTEELIKANDIIRKLQSEIKSTTSKVFRICSISTFRLLPLFY